MRYDRASYEKEVRDFVWNVPAQYNIVDVVEGHAKRNPSKLAILWEDAEGNARKMTYGELVEGMHRFGESLMRLGVNCLLYTSPSPRD